MRQQEDMLPIIKHASERECSHRVSDAISCGSFSKLEAVVWNSMWKLVDVTSETFHDNVLYTYTIFCMYFSCIYGRPYLQISYLTHDKVSRCQ
jgi:hypothetical protein